MGCHLGKGAVVGNSLRCGLHHRLINVDGRFERDRNGDLQQETFLVEDLGSVNGTVINDAVKLGPRQPRTLEHGDRLRLGETTLHFMVG